MKSFIAKRVISILVNLRYSRFKLLKYKENKKICNTFDHNFKNIPLYIMSNVSLERYYFVLYDGALTLKMSKMALNEFCDKTLQLMTQISSLIVRRLTWLFKKNHESCIVYLPAINNWSNWNNALKRRDTIIIKSDANQCDYVAITLRLLQADCRKWRWKWRGQQCIGNALHNVMIEFEY